MRTSHDWAILHEMQAQGEWSEVVWQYADTPMAASDVAMLAEDTATDGSLSGYRAGLRCNYK